MNGLIRITKRVACVRPIRQSLSWGSSAEWGISTSKPPFTRTMWSMCSHNRSVGLKMNNITSTCLRGCGCGIRQIHTKGDKELVEFLTEEIEAEKKTQKPSSLPTQIDGFQVSFCGSEVTLTNKSSDETVVVTFNVNHTVDTDPGEAEIDPKMDKPEMADMKSKPSFEVDIEKGSRTLSFSCSFVQDAGPQESEEGFNDLFGIDEVTLYEGDWTEKTYAVAGDILDGYLYDLLMNILEERGVSSEFVEKLSDFSTAYEHRLYVSMLENLQKFAGGK